MPNVATPEPQVQPKLQPPKKKRKWPRRLIIIVAAAALLFLALRACGSGAVQQMASGSFLPAPVTKQPMAVTVTGSGTVKPKDSYRATTLLRGEILTAPFEEGDVLKKDDVLFTLDATDVEDAIRQAELNLESAKDGVARAEVGVASALQQVEQAKLQVKSAQLNYDSLLRSRKDDTADRQVKANANGVIAELYVDPGDNVAAGTPIADILDRDTVKLVVPFHSVHTKNLAIGQSATVAVTGTLERFEGKITEIAATDAVGTGGTLTRNVTIEIKNPGTLSATSTGSALIGEVASASTGAFRYSASKQLVALYSGKLETLNVKEGDRVFDGQVLGEFEEKSFQDQIDAAAIQLENAKLGVEAAQNGVENARVSLNDAKLAQQNAENTLNSARDNLEDYTIQSPINGTVIEKNFKAGDNYDPSTATGYMAVIYDMSELTFDMNVSELDVSRLRVGQSVTFTSDALEGVTFTGHVDKININGTTAGGTTNYPVTVVVDSGEGLYPGMNVSATIMVEDLGETLTVPVEAVQRGESGSAFVYFPLEGALNEKGELTDITKLDKRAVEVGQGNADNVQILSGLSEGDTVYIPNQASNTMTTMMQQMGG